MMPSPKHVAGALLAIALGSSAIADPRSNAGAAQQHAAPPPGNSHVTYYIVVNKFGRRIRGTHGTTSAISPDGNGTYIADFPVPVTNCEYVATLGRATTDGGVHETAGFITVAGANSDANGVYIQTFGLGVKLRNRPFHLLVAC
jgi:hypothetical protein